MRARNNPYSLRSQVKMWWSNELKKMQLCPQHFDSMRSELNIPEPRLLWLQTKTPDWVSGSPSRVCMGIPGKDRSDGRWGLTPDGEGLETGPSLWICNTFPGHTFRCCWLRVPILRAAGLETPPQPLHECEFRKKKYGTTTVVKSLRRIGLLNDTSPQVQISIGAACPTCFSVSITCPSWCLAQHGTRGPATK